MSPPPPVASFAASPATGIYPLTVHFNDTSTGGTPTTWNWSFGDGSWFNTTDAALANTTWIYSAVGTYNATLTVSNVGGTNTSAVTTVTVLPTPPVANFTVNRKNGYYPLSITFNDTSLHDPATSLTWWNWSFGDGSWYNTTIPASRNTTHVYSTNGSYIARLTVTDTAGQTNTTDPGTTITVSIPLPVANFTAIPTIGTVPLTVTFNDTSTGNGIVSYSWILGDGFTTSERNFTHTFLSAGLFSVNHSARNPSGYGWKNLTGCINVTYNPPVASFAASPATGIHPLTVHFNDTSTGGTPTAWNWSFGDGSWFNTTNAALANTTWVYSAAGTYNATLTVSNAGGPDTSAVTPITVLPTPPVANFTVNRKNGYYPLSVTFNDTSLHDPATSLSRWNWSFGDGSWYNTTLPASRNTTHVYSTNGSYITSLTVTDVTGQTNTTNPGTTISVSIPLPVANFTAIPTIGTVPLTVTFNDTSTGNGIVSYSWILGDGFTTSERNFTHTFLSAGLFSVNHSARNPSGYGWKNVTGCINVTYSQPVASFTTSRANGTIPLDVRFNDTSIGGTLTAWNWSFGDGSWFNTTDIAQRNATHRFGTRGRYTVTLTVSNAGGSNTTAPGKTVTATAPPTASFSYSPVTGYAPHPVQFNDTSSFDTYTSLSAWNWSFDGGTSWTNLTDPTLRNMTHTFPAAGTFSAVLVVSDANGGNSTVNHTVTVLQPTINITGNTPVKGTIGTKVPVTITGINFTSSPAMRVNLTRGPEVIQATEVKVTVPNKIACKFVIPLGASGGLWNLTVTRPDGDYGTKMNAFNVSVLKNPKITAINPTSGYVNSTTAFSLAGSNFIPGSVVTFSNATHAITAVLDPITKTSKITGNLTTNASSLLGKWNITIVLPDGRSSIKTYAFMLKPWTKPAVSSMMPSSGNPNMTYSFSINGNLFEKSGTVVILTRGVPGEFIPTTLTNVNLKKITGTVFIPPGTAEMKWNLSVTTPDGGTTIKNGAFTVKPWLKPGISSINQTKGVHGSTISYAISGTNFQPGSTVNFTNSSAPGLNFTAGVSTLTASKITGAVTIPADRTGKYGIEVVCPDGKVASKANAFTIT